MANYPKKMKDPTETALTAIQEALSTSEQPAGARSGAPGEATAQQREASRRSARTASPVRGRGLSRG
jgi:hypothetical protein